MKHRRTWVRRSSCLCCVTDIVTVTLEYNSISYAPATCKIARSRTYSINPADKKNGHGRSYLRALHPFLQLSGRSTYLWLQQWTVIKKLVIKNNVKPFLTFADACLQHYRQWTMSAIFSLSCFYFTTRVTLEFGALYLIEIHVLHSLKVVLQSNRKYSQLNSTWDVSILLY